MIILDKIRNSSNTTLFRMYVYPILVTLGLGFLWPSLGGTPAMGIVILLIAFMETFLLPYLWIIIKGEGILK